MIICVGCQTEMRCDKNGVGANFGNGHVYPADRFRCPRCGAMALITNRTSIYDPDLTKQVEYLNMRRD
jgi:DNA-directed RNA polymerase subunit RPC12/RpoP